MGLFVYIAFTMEVWFRLLPPHEYVCLALGQQPEESLGSLEFVYLSHGAPALPRAPDSATEEGRQIDTKLKSSWSVTSAWTASR